MIVIIDYGMGNIRSILKAFNRLEIETKVTSKVHDIEKAKKLILPGVGHFANGMRLLKELNLLEVLDRKVMIDQIPILGICLGMQLFSKKSEEGNAAGLDWLDAVTVRFHVGNSKRFKIPHMGWNSLEIKKESELMDEIHIDDLFYFAHSYHMICQNKEDILSTTIYDYEFVSAVYKDNIFGTQFHPEKSHKSGIKILKNFSEKI